MNTRLLTRTAVLIGIVLVLAGLFGLAWNSSLIVFTKTLEVTPFMLIHADTGGYGANVTDQGNDVAHIYVRVPQVVYSQYNQPIEVLVSIWHREGTKLNSLRLVFSSNQLFSMALEVPEGYPWSTLQFHRTSDSRGILLDVADLGFQGEGTVTLQFLIENYPQTLSLNLNVQFTMQNTAPLQFSKYAAEGQVSTQTSRA